MSDLIGNPEDRFSHGVAHMVVCILQILALTPASWVPHWEHPQHRFSRRNKQNCQLSSTMLLKCVSSRVNVFPGVTVVELAGAQVVDLKSSLTAPVVS